MNEKYRERHRREWEKLEKDVELEYKNILKDISQINIEVEPNDVEISSNERGFWEHEIVNLSPFDVVCRIRMTNSRLFSTSENVFIIKQKQAKLLKISRAPHQIRSHHLKIDVIRHVESFEPKSLLDYFIGPYAFKTFIVRYHGAPRYWSDALEMNDWIPDEIIDEKWETLEKKKTSKEKKSSLEASELSSSNENPDPEEDLGTIQRANMNTTNLMITANQAPEELKLESESDVGSDFDEALENELANMSV
ncbi:hypothetical protein GCK72_010256 [Caenorhabditis remanei]|uniref:Uncharacterized protein n=1 Tax=Caenorhabditis remanei TaxID=31234 RepID=A0A2P4V9Z9_CAERE|nr:hypothetical protein GCK72_010256 [Caenorhabditis remanei]KAF1761996.1 hypothetical protein GCK72_010256 [Caenorhabditis remanei]